MGALRHVLMLGVASFATAGATGPLQAIIAGCEGCGTTALSWLIKNAEDVWSGFECGFLEAPTPADFSSSHPFYEWMTHVKVPTPPGSPRIDGELLGGWHVNASGMAEILAAPDHLAMYEVLKRVSPVLAQMGPRVRVLDKTPRYWRQMEEIQHRAPGVPVVFIYKDSHAEHNMFKDIGDAQNRSRVLVVTINELRRNTGNLMRSIFAHIGLDGQWDDSFVNMTGIYRKLAPIYGDCTTRYMIESWKFRPSTPNKRTQTSPRGRALLKLQGYAEKNHAFAGCEGSDITLPSFNGMVHLPCPDCFPPAPAQRPAQAREVGRLRTTARRVWGGWTSRSPRVP